MIEYHKKPISGILLLDKPLGVSSNKAIQIAKHIFSAAKCGHTGTLDPVATGLLPICFGEATKFASMLLCADKSYQAHIKLGFLSTTGDMEGEIQPTATVEKKPSRQECEQILAQFIGKSLQIPPMHSALKHCGKPLYVYARNNETIERKAREIIIHKIHIESLEHNELCLQIHCGTGTYIRTLAEDIGKALGCGGAYLTALRRTSIGNFEISRAYRLTELEAMDKNRLANCLLPIDSFLAELPPVFLDKTAALHLIQGRIVTHPQDTQEIHEPKLVRLYNDMEQFLGLGELNPERKIIAKRLLSNDHLLQKQ